MPEWFEALDAPTLEQVSAKGWNKPAGEVISDIFKAHREAQSFIGSDPSAIVKLPKGAADPGYQAAYDRIVGMNLPASPDGYVFDDVKFKDGTALDPEDQQFVRDLAVKNKIPLPAAKAFAQALVERVDAALEGGANAEAAAKAQRDAVVRSTWGAEYDQKAFSASQAADTLKALGLAVPDGEGMSAEDYAKHMNGLVTLGAQLKEAPLLRGGGRMVDTMSNLAPDAARAQLDTLMQSSSWREKALDPATDEFKQLDNLQRSIAAGNVHPNFRPKP
jgi:hypothetical protein